MFEAAARRFDGRALRTIAVTERTAIDVKPMSVVAGPALVDALRSPVVDARRAVVARQSAADPPVRLRERETVLQSGAMPMLVRMRLLQAGEMVM